MPLGQQHDPIGPYKIQLDHQVQTVPIRGPHQGQHRKHLLQPKEIPQRREILQNGLRHPTLHLKVNAFQDHAEHWPLLCAFG